MERYWKCPLCHGAGEVIVGYDDIQTCRKCDGTGNAYVDGEAAAHRRRLDEIRRRNQPYRGTLSVLRLDADEVAELEKWMTEPCKPTKFMMQAAATHNAPPPPRRPYRPIP